MPLLSPPHAPRFDFRPVSLLAAFRRRVRPRRADDYEPLLDTGYRILAARAARRDSPRPPPPPLTPKVARALRAIIDARARKRRRLAPLSSPRPRRRSATRVH